MSPAPFSVSSIPKRAKPVDGEGNQHFSFKRTDALSKPVHENEISTKHKIVVYSRNSMISNTSNRMRDLEINLIYDLDDGMPTSRTFSQDDCLHTECAPLRSALHGSSLIGRARYNFQQGLLNTKEVLETQRFSENKVIAGSKGEGLTIAHNRFSIPD